MKPLVFRPAAAADVEEAYRWYEDQRRGLGEEFLSVVQAALDSAVGDGLGSHGAGARVQVGEVRLELTNYTHPCRNISSSFLGEVREGLSEGSSGLEPGIRASA